jgi:AcrR family transcriptional regulator
MDSRRGVDGQSGEDHEGRRGPVAERGEEGRQREVRDAPFALVRSLDDVQLLYAVQRSRRSTSWEPVVVDATRGRPGPRRTLSQQAFLDAAMALLADRGADGVSIRGIATRVGVAPNAVYTYFPNKAAVLKALIEQLLGRVNHDRFVDPTQPWRTRIRALALELRAELLAQPGAVQLLLRAPLNGANALAVGETLLDIFADAGLAPEDAARASYLLSVHVLGSIAMEVAGLDHAAPLAPETDRIAARAATFAAVPADRYPRAAAVTVTMAGYISTEQFVWGLERLLDGVAIPRPPAASVGG